ncbi:MAG TPA: carboxypeptidase-like regulatory domain-containing protein, partial [Blastocatellia bacterium]
MNRMSILLLTVICASPARTATGLQDQAKTAPSNRIEQNSVEQNPAPRRREGSITGRVIGPDGQPMADARVFAYRIGENSGSSHSAAVADDGSFKLTGLQPGLYNVEAGAPGHISAEAPGGNAIHRIGENLTIALIKGGVVTGRVTDEAGEPIVGVGVRLIRLRDPEGRTAASREDTFDYRFGVTDDRGIYRVFGLQPGVYIANIGTGNSTDDSQIRGDSPTYYPSATRDTAAEINLRGDEEVSGVDIRHRGDRGRVVSGSVSGEVASSSSSPVSVSLIDPDGGRDEADTSTSSARGFAFYGVPDGDYELVATRWAGSNETSGLGRRRVSVKGADVNGVELKLAPNGSISGRVIIEPSTTPGRCEIKDDPADNRGAGQIQEQTGGRPALEE